MDKLRKNMNVPAGAMLFAALFLIGVWIGWPVHMVLAVSAFV